jgi:hypothetical protein
MQHVPSPTTHLVEGGAVEQAQQRIHLEQQHLLRGQPRRSLLLLLLLVHLLHRQPSCSLLLLAVVRFLHWYCSAGC